MPNISEKEIKEELIKRFANLISEPEMKTWIFPLDVETDGTNLSIICKNEFTKRYISTKSRFLSVFESISSELNLKLSFQTKKDQNPKTNIKKSAECQKENTPTFSSNFSRKTCNKEDSVFIETPENSLILKSFELIFTKNQKHLSPLLIYGKSGTGKSFLGNIFLSYRKSSSIYVESEEFVDEYFREIKEGKNILNNKFYDKEAIFIDNIEYLEKRKGAQLKLAFLFDKVVKNGSVILLSSSKKPDELKIDNRLKDRICSGLVLELKELSSNSIKAFFKKENIHISKKEISSIKTFREIKRFLAQKSFLKEMESNTFCVKENNKRNHCKPQEIIYGFLKNNKLTMSDLKKRANSIYKTILVYKLRNNGVSYKKIAVLLGYSNHSSAIYAYRRAIKYFATNNSLFYID